MAFRVGLLPLMLLVLLSGSFALAETAVSFTRRPGTALRLPVSDSRRGELREVSFSTISSREREVILKSSRGERRVRTRVAQVTDGDGLVGVVVEQATGTDGIFADFSTDTPHFYRLRASTRRSGEHEISEISGADILPERVCAALTGDGAQVQVPELGGTAGIPSFQFGFNSWREVELVVVAPSEFGRNRSEQQVVAQILTTVGAANLFFEPLGLAFQVVGIELFTDPASDPYDEASRRQNSSGMLSTVREEWSQRTSPKHDLVAVLGSGKYRNTYGLGYTGASCVSSDHSFVFATQGGTTAAAEISLAATLAHEFGHFVGMGHDSTSYPTGPSLMSPVYVAKPEGFSDYSISEYMSHAAPGRPGGECFTSMATPPSGGGSSDTPTSSPRAPLRFLDGGAPVTLHVNEGEMLSQSFQAEQADGMVVYSASSLPLGATLDSGTGLLRYTPHFDTTAGRQAKAKVQVTVIARSFDQQISRQVNLIVYNQNRPPRFVLPREESITAHPGEQVVIKLVAEDYDRGDRLRLSHLTREVFRTLPGRKKFRASGGTGELSWDVPPQVHGEFTFSFVARDGAGASTQTVFVVRVKSRAVPPTISVPREITALNGNFVFSVIAGHPLGVPVRLEFEHLPDGSVVEYRADGAEVRGVIDPVGAPVPVLVRAQAEEQVATELLTIVPVAKREAKADTSSIWPGAPRKHGPTLNDNESIVTYDNVTGSWVERNCSGEVVSKTQFGGFIGDHPVDYQSRGKQTPIIYRVIDGQGYWYINAGRSTEMIPWGLSGDIPVAGDIDGDKRLDLLIYRPMSGEWHVRLASGELMNLLVRSPKNRVGGQPIIPFTGDVNGDGTSELIEFSRTENGVGLFSALSKSGSRQDFVVLTEQDSVQPFIPYVTDVDQDGRSDFAVLTSSNVLHLFSSQAGRKVSLDLQASVYGNSEVQTCNQGDAVAVTFVDFRTQAIGVSELQHARGRVATVGKLERGAGRPLSFLHRARARRLQQSNVSDIDGDRRSDFLLWRPYEMERGGYFLAQTASGEGQIFPEQLVSERGFAIIGDFQGNGVGAPTVFSAGTWRSEDRSADRIEAQWGIAGDLPVPGDYNGDGITDYAVFRPSDGTWWTLIQGRNAPTAAVTRWGKSGDQPVVGDFDGDGVSDRALFRQERGEWWIRYENGQVDSFQLGAPGDKAVPLDYNADGKTEAAIFRASEGLWLIRDGSNIIRYAWGLTGDLPVPADFNGDGRDDLVVFRPSEGRWYLRFLDSLLAKEQVISWGVAGDRPIR